MKSSYELQEYFKTAPVKGLIGCILAGAVWMDAWREDYLEVKIIYEKRRINLYLYSDDILLRSWNSDTPCFIRCFFEEEELMELKEEDAEWLSFYCKHPDTATEDDLHRIRQSKRRKREDEENRKFNEEMRRQAELIGRFMDSQVSIEKYAGPPKNNTWWDKKSQRRIK